MSDEPDPLGLAGPSIRALNDLELSIVVQRARKSINTNTSHGAAMLAALEAEVTKRAENKP